MPKHLTARAVIENPEAIRSLAGRAITRPNAMDLHEIAALATTVIALLDDKAAKLMRDKQAAGVPY